MFGTPRLHRFKIPESRMFAILRLRRSKIPENREFFAPENTHLKNFVKLDVSRVTGFPEFPNTSPSGKWVDSDDPIPRKQEFW
jgi:hypothetical protein